MPSNDLTPAMPSNDLTPAMPNDLDTSVPLHELGPIDTAVPQNVLSPFAPLHPISPDPVAPVTTTRLTAEDTRELSQSLARIRKLNGWIATALVEVQALERSVSKILHR